MKKVICILVLAALLLAGCGKNAAPTFSTDAPTSAGKTAAAPNFTVYDGSNRQVKLSDYIGTPVVLNFWASWCGPCKSEMPEFQKAFERNGDSVQFLMVDVGESQADGEAFISSAGYTFPVFFDLQSDAANAYRVSAIRHLLHQRGWTDRQQPCGRHVRKCPAGRY